MSVSVAARDNASWCATVCRAHGGGGVFGRQAWTSAQRTPVRYPDAVTLSADADAAEILAAVDIASGCSVKDSFASLDLAGAGFVPIIEAHWIERSAERPSPSRPTVAWSVVRSADGLAAWAASWDSGPSDLFGPALLADAAVQILAAHRGGAVVAGAVVHRSEQGVAGVSNLFAADGDLDSAWAGVLGALRGEHVVGYDRGPALDAALRLGFTVTGPLRVWLYPE